MNDVFDSVGARGGEPYRGGNPIRRSAEFAMAYTDQTERDRRAFVDAIKADRISASTPGLFLGSVIGASGPGGPASGPLLRTIAHLVLRRTERCQDDLTGAPLILTVR